MPIHGVILIEVFDQCVRRQVDNVVATITQVDFRTPCDPTQDEVIACARSI